MVMQLWCISDEIQQDAEMSMITEEEPDSPRYIEHMQVIDKLQKALIEADQLIKNERREKKQLESDLHKEFRKKIAAHTAKIEADHEHQMAEEKQRHEDYVEEKVNLISSAINKSAKRKLDKAEEEILKKEAQLKEYEADILKLKEQLKQIQGNSESCSDIKNSKDTQEEVTLLREQLEDAQKALIEKDKKLAEVMESKKTVMADLETIKSESSVGGEKLQSVSEEVILLRQNLDDLQKTLLEKEKELAEVNEIKCSLMDNLEAAKTLNTDFRSQISKLNEEKNKYTSTVKELELEVRAVSRGLQESDRSKEEAEKGLAEMRKKKELAEFELLEKTCQLETAQSESEQLSQQIAHRTEEYDALVLEMDQLKETLHSLQNSNSTQELETKCDSLTDKMKKLQDQLRRRSVEWKGDLGTVQTQLMTSKRELERVKREKDKLNKDNSDHQVELVELRKKHAAESDELESIKEQLSQLETNYQEKEENLSTITSKAIQLESELAEEKSLKLELELEKQNLRDLLRTSENQASSLESTVYRLRKEISKLEKSDLHSKENQELKDELASLQVSLKESETRCQKFSALESKLNETNEKMKNQTLLHQSATSTIQKLTEENENLRVKVDSSILVDTLKKQVYELKENVSIKENKAASLQVILDARQSEWERKDGSLETLKQKVQEADEKNVQLQEHLDGARTELQSQ
ncbi:hypothetical protein EB796_005798 [Bugula neritina]|uniref:Uncharacterized protein n=1 Tax=Bugula neritina TaxID=10212 RepID=A0A7J7KB53_BUGNE|nr:hypothetical protein EB796_005798 [Bugula neritina]